MRDLVMITGAHCGGTKCLAQLVEAMGFDLGECHESQLEDYRLREAINSEWVWPELDPCGSPAFAREQVLDYINYRRRTCLFPAAKNPQVPLIYHTDMKEWPVKWVVVRRPIDHILMSWINRWGENGWGEAGEKLQVGDRPQKHIDFIEMLEENLDEIEAELDCVSVNYYDLIDKPDEPLREICRHIAAPQRELSIIKKVINKESVHLFGDEDELIDYKSMYDELYKFGYHLDPFCGNNGIKEFYPWLLEKYEFDSCLDVGCANGIAVEFMADADKLSKGLEVSSYGVETALEHERDVVQGSALFMPFADNSFDMVMSSDVMEHFCSSDLDVVINEMKRVSKKYVAAKIACRLDRVTRWKNVAGMHLHRTVLPIEEWVHRFEEKGMKLVEQKDCSLIFKLQ